MSGTSNGISTPTDFSKKGKGNEERARERENVRAFKFSGGRTGLS